MNIDQKDGENHGSPTFSSTETSFQERTMEENNEKSVGLFEHRATSAEKQQLENIPDGPSPEPLAEAGPPGVDHKQEDFSIFTTVQKRLMVSTASLASLFSPMATAIYCLSLLIILLILVD